MEYLKSIGTQKVNSAAFSHPIISWTGSLLAHIIIVFLSVIMFRESIETHKGDQEYVHLSAVRSYEKNIEPSAIREEPATEPNIPKEPQSSNISENAASTNTNQALPSFIGSADTSSLQQVYAERTLNVRVRFPMGWTYLDQNRKNKLDGVTFFGSSVGKNPPPYIHLEVKEKYLFNSSRYKYKFELNNSIAYYNDPEEMEEYVTQIFYLVTETNEDYSLKLSVKGRDNFNSYQSLFFGMLKTFRFGSYF